jgi:anti-sigma B factor antagonist
MASTPLSDGPRSDRTHFACRWRLEGRAAASVRVAGDLDHATAPQLRTALEEALVYARLVLVDVSDVSFMDSSGLRVILEASIGARSQDARVLLVGVSEQVEALIDLTATRPHIDLLRLDGGDGQLDRLDAVTDAVVALHLRYHGLLPGTAKTLLLDDDLLACVLEGAYADGGTADVPGGGREFQAGTRHIFINAVQRLSGRPVTGFISNYHVGPDIAVELFLLDAATPRPSM